MIDFKQLIEEVKAGEKRPAKGAKSFHVTIDTYEAAQRLASKQGVSLSSLVDRFLSHYLSYATNLPNQHRGAEPPPDEVGKPPKSPYKRR